MDLASFQMAKAYLVKECLLFKPWLGYQTGIQIVDFISWLKRLKTGHKTAISKYNEVQQVQRPRLPTNDT